MNNNKIADGISESKKVFDLLFLLYVTLFILFIVLVCFFPFWLTNSAIFDELNFTEKGNIGNAIGGIMSPFIASAAALLTFIAFWVQYKANIAQTNQFNKQDIDTKIDRFENKFYELLRLHKQNVDEISIDGYDQRKIEKRKAFYSMYREFRNAFFVSKVICEGLRESGDLHEEYSDADLLELAYYFFYAGVGIHSEKLNKALIGTKYSEILYDKVNAELISIKDTHKQKSKDKCLPELEILGLGKSMTPKSYRPFVGHANRFGHYYRHLFQTVKFVVDQNDELIDKSRKIEYLRTLRAQLSDYEQVMLYYNAIVGLGKAWLDKGYLTDFRMIHNMPLPLADFGVIPAVKFEKEIAQNKDLFEWLSVEKSTHT
jgi:hypothetical protein